MSVVLKFEWDGGKFERDCGSGDSIDLAEVLSDVLWLADQHLPQNSAEIVVAQLVEWLAEDGHLKCFDGNDERKPAAAAMLAAARAVIDADVAWRSRMLKGDK